MILPKEKTKAEIQSPETLVIYGPPKIGKTTLQLFVNHNFILANFILEYAYAFTAQIKFKRHTDDQILI